MKMRRAQQLTKCWAVAVMLGTFIGSGLAQAKPNTSTGGAAKPAAPSASSTAAPATAVPQAQAIYLIRSTLMTLNDANRSGNYTVLRDLAAPDFATRNSPADLSVIFTDLRRRRVDLFAVAMINPVMDQPIALDKNGRLHLAGHFPTNPLQIKFDLLYQNTGGQWKLYGVSVQTPAAAPPPSAPTQRR